MRNPIRVRSQGILPPAYDLRCVQPGLTADCAKPRAGSGERARFFLHGEIAWADSAGATGIDSENNSASRNPLASKSLTPRRFDW